MPTLACATLHPAFPLLDPGVQLRIKKVEDALELAVPLTRRIIGSLVAALKDGALIITDPADPFWAEVEAFIYADRDRLFKQAEDLAAVLRDQRTALAG